ncbi:unnamed protein product [Mytilus coruscus]|uniref:Uncharacterized protein n=1 Tax=Mytilus coruscus TaxID=42192 RepID=A0A6J8CL28_MYTCO|nr:unnamed protein product [Mytilus coruscus]
MDQLKPPIALSKEGNVSENWRKWKQKFQFYLDATEFNEKAEKLQCSLLLHCIGEDAVEVFNTFNFLEDEKDQIAPLQLKFEQFCNPIKNQTYERYKFHTCSQSEGENLYDSFVRDRIVCGILSDNVRERLLRIPDLTLAKSIDICRASEVSKQQLKSITEDEKTVHAIRKDYKSGHKPRVKHQYKDSRKDNPKGQKYDCKKCGMQHLPRSCQLTEKRVTSAKSRIILRRCANAEEYMLLKKKATAETNYTLDVSKIRRKVKILGW